MTNKHGRKINKNVKVISNVDDDKKSDNHESRNNSQHSDARKISSRLGVDTQLLIKRK